jgi:hypothetical protein
MFVKLIPSRLRSILYPLAVGSLFCQRKSISLDDTAVAAKLDGATGVWHGEAVGVGLGGGVGVGILVSMWIMLATEGTPFEFRINSM